MKLLTKPGNVFRSAQNAIERKVQTSHEGVVLQPSNFWMRAITWSLVGCCGRWVRKGLSGC